MGSRTGWRHECPDNFDVIGFEYFNLHILRLRLGSPQCRIDVRNRVLFYVAEALLESGISGSRSDRIDGPVGSASPHELDAVGVLCLRAQVYDNRSAHI